MTINTYKKHFLEALSAEFSPEEAQSFFAILVQEWLGLSRLDIALNPNSVLSAEEIQKLNEGLERLKQHEPVQYITGSTEFLGLQYRIDPSVLIPRPETEELVQWVLEDLDQRAAQKIRILDIGTGSGCIAISLAKNLPQAEVWAMDISRKALQTAELNARINGTEVHFIEMDVLKGKRISQGFDVIVSNPPYVRELEKRAMHKNVLDHEPGSALYVKDSDPLIFYEAIRDFAVNHLEGEKALYFEINQYLGKETEDLLREKNFHTTLKKDIFGEDRMLKGQL